MLNPLFLYQAIVLALGQIWANKGRSFLTTLAIIIGVAAVCAVIAGLDGFKVRILTDIERFGANKMFIFPDRHTRCEKAIGFAGRVIATPGNLD